MAFSCLCFCIDKMSVSRYNIVMTFLDLLSEKKTTVYSLSLHSGVPRTTLADIASGKTDILECTGKTLLAISKSLNVSIEDLLSLEREEAKTVLPEFLYEAINEYRKAIRKDSTLIDCYSDQLNSSINVAEVENLISKELADRLRKRYFWRE
ncbi:XRE family transcriptional regulator [Treponema rectale]|uniref:XRE family transcriptional regulator n=1 Tax=Treponema rectale TaxID=744512 RepID=A0A7M1XLK5_9SPIR|nr:XRE family transcriptional regulator [Treponema rectale]